VYSHEATRFGGLISQRREGQTYYHHYDALGSTRQLTDAGENVTDEYVYTAWGEPVVANGTTENPYRWVGRWGYYWDQATETYYVRRRDYQPAIARWRSQDSWAFADLWNLYRYVNANAPTRIDPSGSCPPDACYITGIIFVTDEAKAKELTGQGDDAGAWFSNPRGWPAPPDSPDLNAPGPFQRLAVVVDGETTGKFNNVHWVVFMGCNLEDCTFARFARVETKDVTLGYEVLGIYKADAKIEPTDADVNPDGPQRWELYRKDSVVALADAPGNNPDPKARGVLPDRDFHMKWNFLITAKSAKAGKVVAKAWWDVEIAGTYTPGKVQEGFVNSLLRPKEEIIGCDDAKSDEQGHRQPLP
jgi:RHS repeat-associated protein